MYDLPFTMERSSFPEAKASAMRVFGANGRLKVDGTRGRLSNFRRPERGLVASHAKHAECSDDSGNRNQDKHDGHARVTPSPGKSPRRCGSVVVQKIDHRVSGRLERVVERAQAFTPTNSASPES
jgi:hypothetical protein